MFERLNDRVWDIGFNWLTEMNELPVRGREHIYFDFEFDINRRKGAA